MNGIISDLFSTHQGAFLTGLSSLMCICGAASIYLDTIIKAFYPNSSFDIRSSEQFLVCGFSLSSGSLLVTSLYRLLPRALKYFKDSKTDTVLGPSTAIVIFYMAGITICAAFNYAIHMLTSESIVHCSHDEPVQHLHDYEYENDHDHDHEHSHDHHHDHSHSNGHTETSPLVPPSTRRSEPLFNKKKTLFELTFGKLTRRHSHPCIGVTDTNCEGDPSCVDSEIGKNVSNDLHNLEFYSCHSTDGTKGSLVAYTHSNSDTSADSTEPLITPVTNIRLTSEPIAIHSAHKNDHHHQINTPISKILSIGIQTCFALTLHKFPEGFITYATSKADPKLGISIFLSLAIHNVVEGFTMTLPLYIALNSRIKAFAVTFVLGGFSQPIGAVLAYLTLKNRAINKENSFFVFGVLLSITAGFLTIISLQLFASSISFGGSSTKVIAFCIIGIFIIQLSNALTDDFAK